MAYPSSFDTFVGTQAQGTTTLAGNDHALDHRQLGSAAANLQTTVGTTGGTNVLKNFAAGDFPARIAAGTGTWGTLRHELVGTINNSVFGTPALTGGTYSAGVINSSTVNNPVIGTPALTGGTFTLPQVKTYTLGSAVITGTVSTTQNLDLSTATRFLVNMANSAGSVTLTVSNVTANQLFLVEILQGTAGLGTINWFSTIRWSGSATPTQTLTASRKDTFGFIATSTNTFDGYIVGQNI